MVYLGELVVEMGIGVAVGVAVEHQHRDVVAVLGKTGRRRRGESGGLSFLDF